MTLKTLFAIPIAIILLVTLSLAGMIAVQGWSDLERGKAAVEAVEKMRLLIELQAMLRAERIASNFVLGLESPLSEAARGRLDVARRDTDRAAAAINAMQRNAAENAATRSAPEPYMVTVADRMGAVRATIDELLTRDLSARTLGEIATVMPRMLAASQAIDNPTERASVAVTRTDASLSGLVIEDRLAESLRDQVGLIAAVLLPRYDKAEQPSIDELEQMRLMLARSAYLTQLLGTTNEIAGANEMITRSLLDLTATNVTGILERLMARTSERPADETELLPPQRILAAWGERINVVRTAIADAMVKHVTRGQNARERQFDIVLAAFGVVVVAVLESVVSLSHRVVGPLAQLGLAITRIAAGDRATPLTIHSGTREIQEMATAVETLRQAALVADATTLRQRQVARLRAELLRQALGIAQTVREPARALERGVARLSVGIDATIAMFTTETTAPPATLRVAADAVRAGLTEMRASAAELDAALTAVSPVQTEDWPEAEFVAQIQAVRAQVDRRDKAVRGFVQAGLLALRDATPAVGEPPAPALRELVSDQFARIEEAVAAISSMRAKVARAMAIVQDLPVDDMPMAA